MIKVGDKLPENTFSLLTNDGMTNPTTEELFGGKKVVVFAVPGAFTPTCSASHLPGFVVKADELKAKGVDSIICLSVNDAFVMKSWGDASNAEAITMLADGIKDSQGNVEVKDIAEIVDAITKWNYWRMKIEEWWNRFSLSFLWIVIKMNP